MSHIYIYIYVNRYGDEMKSYYKRPRYDPIAELERVHWCSRCERAYCYGSSDNRLSSCCNNCENCYNKACIPASRNSNSICSVSTQCQSAGDRDMSDIAQPPLLRRTITEPTLTSESQTSPTHTEENMKQAEQDRVTCVMDTGRKISFIF